MPEHSDVVMCFEVDEAADARGVIPFGSSLAAAAIGDAICFAILGERPFDEKAFRQIHPGGAVGRTLCDDDGG